MTPQPSCSSASFPYGVFVLTLIYVCYVLLIHYAVPVPCLNEPCDSEGLDNSVLGFSTDFGIALGMLLLGTQLKWYVQRPVERSAVFAQWTMGIGYVFGGLGHSVFANSGFDDNRGERPFYVMWVFRFAFLTWSSYWIYRFTRNLQKRYHAVAFQDAAWGLLLSLRIAWYLNFLAFVAVFTGYTWCATDKEILVKGAIDTVPPISQTDGVRLERQLDVCLQVANAGEISWYCTFALLWIPVSIILRRVILRGGHRVTEADQPRKVYGLWNSWAALWIAIIPWTFGIMLIVWTRVVAAMLPNQSATDVYKNIYGAVVYHYGMLLGYFLLHNIAYSLPQDEAVVPWPSASNKANKSHGDDLESVGILDAPTVY